MASPESRNRKPTAKEMYTKRGRSQVREVEEDLVVKAGWKAVLDQVFGFIKVGGDFS